MELNLDLVRLPDGAKACSFEQLAGGANNRVFRIFLQDGSSCVAKFYFENPHDQRDRLAAEYGAFAFLWGKGERSIPQPLSVDYERRSAVYSFLEGRRKDLAGITTGDIDQAVDFIRRLKNYTNDETSLSLPAASEACFSTREVIEVIEKRFQRLSDAVSAVDSAASHELNNFLSQRFIPLMKEVKDWASGNAGSGGLNRETDMSERTLSPSDFGFHNGILNPDGRWVFYDFEYFGWDDPCKLLCDYVLHPGVNLSEDLQKYFMQNAYPVFEGAHSVRSRLEIQFPLWGLKWCMILLNEFIPEHLARRGFALQHNESALHEVQMRQLTKAKRMLDIIENRYEHFFSFFGI